MSVTAVNGWEVTHELLALLVEEVSMLNVDPRQVRTEPIRVPRPSASDDLPSAPGGGASGGAGGPMAAGLHHSPDGGMVAVGLQGMLALAAASGAVATVPADGGAQ